MIRHKRAQSDIRPSTGRTSRWALSRLPASARAFLVLAELIALTTTVVLVAGERAGLLRMLVGAGLLVASVVYAEVTAHSGRMQRYLGSDKVFSNPMSVWSFAAVLVLPIGWAATFVALQYAHAWWQRRRDASGATHRVVFSASAAMIAQLVAGGLIGLGVAHRGPGTTVRDLAAAAGITAFVLVNAAVLITGIALASRPRRLRDLVPDGNTLSYEAGTLVLGLVTAEFMLHSPVLTPLVLVLVVLLHRSSVVSDLQRAVRTDSKTGLLTASAWTAAAQDALSRRGRGDVGILIIDLDHFKRVNDQYGHLVGDRVLGEVGACLRHELRGHDGLGRFGGEEFVAVLAGLTIADTVAIADRLRVAIHHLSPAEGLHVTASVGVAHTVGSARRENLDELLARADHALYVAKQSGRDQVFCSAL